MTILIVLLTLLLVVDCLFLGLLVLIQLPKKEAGIGMAFGSGATDALFGAGSGTALSNLTKYTATAFFVLVFVLSVLNTRAFRPDTSGFKRSIESQSAAPVMPSTSPTASPAATSSAPSLLITTNITAPVAAPPSNTPAAPAK